MKNGYSHINKRRKKKVAKKKEEKITTKTVNFF